MTSRPHSTVLPEQRFDTAVSFALPANATSFYVQCFAHSAVGLEQAANEVRQFARLEPGWDGEEAAQISAEAIGRATRALHTLACQIPVPEVTPNSNGTLTFEWATRAGRANIEIGKSRFSGYVESLGGLTGYFDGTNEDVGAYVGAVLNALLYRSIWPTDPITSVEVVNGR